MQEQLQVNADERLRLLESRYNAVRDRVLITNQNMISGYKKIHEEIRELETDLREIKTDMFEIKNSIKKIAEELRFFAKKEQVKVLEKYIDLWNPLKFVTEEELRRVLEERGDKHTTKTKGSVQPKSGRE